MCNRKELVVGLSCLIWTMALLVLAGVANPAAAKPKDPSPAVAPAESLKSELLKSAGEALLGGEAPWLAGWTLDGEVWNLSRAIADSSANRVAIAFFATWCAPCRHGIRLLRERAEELKRHRVQVILLNFGEDAEKVMSFIGASPPFPVVLDRYGNCKEAYLRTNAESVMLPQTVVVGRNGRIELIIGREGADYVDRIIAGH